MGFFSTLTFTHDWRNTDPINDSPKGFKEKETNGTQVRADIQMLHEESKNAFNGLISELENKLDGQSGADGIGATSISGLSGTTVQALLESIVSVLQSTTDGSSGADFVKATGVSGLSGGSVQALIESLNSVKLCLSGGAMTHYLDGLNGQVRNIHISTADPTSSEGTDGDIWIKYEA